MRGLGDRGRRPSPRRSTSASNGVVGKARHAHFAIVTYGFGGCTDTGKVEEGRCKVHASREGPAKLTGGPIGECSLGRLDDTRHEDAPFRGEPLHQPGRSGGRLRPEGAEPGL